MEDMDTQARTMSNNNSLYKFRFSRQAILPTHDA